jgi:hypothetical protein
MARLFSIDFEFKGKKYLALVSMRQQGTDLSCLVRYVNKELHHLLPGDCLMFNLQEGLKQPCHLPSELAQSLVRSTVNAISDHLQIAD